MASHSDRQYQPVSTRETNTDDALSVRAYSDMADAVNNAHFHACCHKVRSSICFPSWKSWDSYTVEHVVAVFGPVSIPDGFSDLLWTLGHRRTAGAGTVYWRLYSSASRYYGTIETMDSTYLSTDALLDFIVSTADDHEVEHSNPNLPASLIAGGGDLHMVLTATNSDASTRGEITTLDVKPVFL